MRYAVNVPNFEEYSDVRAVAALAADAEAAGWDGFFVWDHLAFVKAWRLRIADPWIVLTAVALATERLRLGPMVTPLARRRPWKVARETVTLDRLSGGRLVLGVGLGEPGSDEFGSFGEPADPVVRAAMLDEALEVLTRLWSGETVSFSGRHYRVDQVAFLPAPVQRPRIPIWVAGTWPRRGPLRRAARFDGSCPLKIDADGEVVGALEAGELRELRAVVDRHRQEQAAPFDVLLGGTTPEDPGAARAMLEPLAEAGMTWWQEVADPRQTDLAAFRRRVRRGPPGG
jgi:alkanesulfonate monooxygenase SsuD/methylene tetrahydromethanopterin reductase-like flavin-dependent oxidoreductase (luciferase family)